MLEAHDVNHLKNILNDNGEVISDCDDLIKIHQDYKSKC